MNSCRRLTADGSLKFTPRYTSGGREVVYAALDGPRMFRLMRLDVAAGTGAAAFPAARASEIEPAVSRDGRYLALVQLRGALSLALVIHDLEKKEKAEVPPAEGFAGMRSPAFAPDGSRVAYAFAEEVHQKIFSVDARAGDRRRLTDGPGVDNWPSFSPDGERVVFGSSRAGVFDLFVMRADGRDVRRLTRGAARSVRPEFSPDGRRIAFARFDGAATRVFVMGEDGGRVRRVELDVGSEGEDYPSWHPDGRRLAVVCQRGGRHDLYEIDVP